MAVSPSPTATRSDLRLSVKGLLGKGSLAEWLGAKKYETCVAGSSVLRASEEFVARCVGIRNTRSRRLRWPSLFRKQPECARQISGPAATSSALAAARVAETSSFSAAWPPQQRLLRGTAAPAGAPVDTKTACPLPSSIPSPRSHLRARFPAVQQKHVARFRCFPKFEDFIPWKKIKKIAM